MNATNLSHILLCAGTVREWAETTVEAWRERIRLIAGASSAGGAAWATIVPNGGQDPVGAATVCEKLVGELDGVRYADRVVLHSDDGVTVIVDPLADGRTRIANAVTRLGSRVVSEQRLSSVLSAPAPGEPDLIVVLGAADLLPASLVWELAYAELVFLDAPWSALDSEHLEMAVDDFRRRNRRFGGLDS